MGFGARPLGALFFGWLGDRKGRKLVLVATVTLMGVSTTCIGLLPTSEQVGVLAPILLVFLRICQGFGAGAELAGASVLLAEFSDRDNRGLFASLVCLGTNTGTLLASGVWLLVSALPGDALLTWARPKPNDRPKPTLASSAMISSDPCLVTIWNWSRAGMP